MNDAEAIDHDGVVHMRFRELRIGEREDNGKDRTGDVL